MSLKLSEITNELTTISAAVDYRWYVYDPSEALETNRSKYVEKAAMLDYFGATAPTEGQWTPSVSGITLTNADGYYIKDGRTVILQFDVTWPTTTNTNAIVMLGAPVEALNNPGGTFNSIYTGSLFHFDSVSSNNPVSSDLVYLLSLGSGLSFKKDGALAADGAIQNVYFSQKRVIGTITYISAT